jgi:hypothetical protein
MPLQVIIKWHQGEQKLSAMKLNSTWVTAYSLRKSSGAIAFSGLFLLLRFLLDKQKKMKGSE